jgi:predicted TPR repeat methyltransferase
MNDSVREADEFWERFEGQFRHHPANLYRYDLVAKLIKSLPHRKDTIVDVGCGNGTLLSFLKARKIGTRHLGFDGSARAIESNRKRLPDIEFGQWDLQDATQAPKLEADIVICTEVIEHMPHYTPAFTASRSLLQPGKGVLILTTQGGPRRRHDIELIGHLRHYETGALVREVEQHGFECIHRQNAGWPFLDLQKILASMLMGRVVDEINSTKGPSLFFKTGCEFIGLGLKISSKSRGPQIVIAAEAV